MATLIRPTKPQELILKITPKRGEIFTCPELYSFVGVDFVTLELPSGDYLLVTKDYKQTMYQKNELASRLIHDDIYGVAIICEPKEID